MTNLNAIKALYEAFAKGDIPTVLGTLSHDIAWTEAEGFPYGGTYNGPKAVLTGVFMRLGSEWDGFAAVPDKFIDGGDTVVVLGKYGGKYKATGKSINVDFAHVWKMQDGKAARFIQYVDMMFNWAGPGKRYRNLIPFVIRGPDCHETVRLEVDPDRSIAESSDLDNAHQLSCTVLR